MITLQRNTLSHTDHAASEGGRHSVESVLDFKTFASLRRMVGFQHRKPLRRADFLKQIPLYLPEVAERIEESDFGIVHLEVGAMKLATRDAIRRGDFTAVSRHLALINELFDRADKELYDAICISYLEALFLGEESAAHFKARCLLSRPMQNVLKQAEVRWKNRVAASHSPF